VFVGVVTDTQWKVFCEAFDLPELLADPGAQDQSAARRSARRADPHRRRVVREDEAGD
jgi:crotonobetainyl-CoA:carnitine CoA-transferase CaiB-like acyl-CoA transferase